MGLCDADTTCKLRLLVSPRLISSCYPLSPLSLSSILSLSSLSHPLFSSLSYNRYQNRPEQSNQGVIGDSPSLEDVSSVHQQQQPRRTGTCWPNLTSPPLLRNLGVVGIVSFLYFVRSDNMVFVLISLFVCISKCSNFSNFSICKFSILDF